MAKRIINNQEYDVVKEGSATPFAYIPGGMKQICDLATNNHVLVSLQFKTVEDLQQHADEQAGVIINLKKELKMIQDELIKKDEEINRLNRQVAELTGVEAKMKGKK